MTPVRKELLRKSRSLMSRAARSVEEANLSLAMAKEIHAHLLDPTTRTIEDA